MVSRRACFPPQQPLRARAPFSAFPVCISRSQKGSCHSGPSERPEPLTCPSLEGLCLYSLQADHVPLFVFWAEGRHGSHQEGFLLWITSQQLPIPPSHSLQLIPKPSPHQDLTLFPTSPPTHGISWICFLRFISAPS